VDHTNTQNHARKLLNNSLRKPKLLQEWLNRKVDRTLANSIVHLLIAEREVAEREVAEIGRCRKVDER